MADTFLLEIITPTGVVLSKEVSEVTAPGTLGEFGVLKDHLEFMTTLAQGKLGYRDGASSKKTLMAVGSGFAEVLPDKTTILVETAISADDIDITEAKKELEKVEKTLEGMDDDNPEVQGLETKRLLARTKVDLMSEIK